MPFQQKLIDWFEKSRRPLPWRKHYRPYDVWVSEIMLQQTQMDTVLPYFDRWMTSFPTLEALAKADEKTVLKHWEGLGYYSRARNLHAGAKMLVEKFSGRFPDDFEEILSIKGIGRYTAGAIASIAFNQEKPIVDGNVFRVLARLYALSKPTDVPKNREEFWELQESLIPKGKAREFNQGLMELGALVCTPQNPSCPACPIRSLCKAYKEGNPEKYPVRSPRKKQVKVEAVAITLEVGGKFLVRLRPVGKIMGGLWEFPEWKLSRDQKMEIEDKLKTVQDLAKKEFGSSTTGIRHLGRVKRNYTHHLESLDVFSLKLKKTVVPKTEWEHAWASKKEFQKYPFSSAHSKIAALLS